jgi:hypothetical protein
MLTIEPSGKVISALCAVSICARTCRARTSAPYCATGTHGVLCFPEPGTGSPRPQAFSMRFGDIQVIKGIPHHEPGMPEIWLILSNVKVDGKKLIERAGRRAVPGTPT